MNRMRSKGYWGLFAIGWAIGVSVIGMLCHLFGAYALLGGNFFWRSVVLLNMIGCIVGAGLAGALADPPTQPPSGFEVINPDSKRNR